MTPLNVHLFDLTPLLFGTASVNYVAYLYGKRETIARIGTWICLAAAVVSTAALGVRWAESYQMGIGRIPVTNLYESLVFFAWSVNLFYLFVEWRYKNRTFGAFVIPIAFGRFPAPKVLDDLVYRSIIWGFPFLTAGIITGAAWANYAWGTYWSWDPKETWSLIVWLVYAAFLHARITRGGLGKRAAILSIVGVMGTLTWYPGGDLVLSGLHSYGS